MRPFIPGRIEFTHASLWRSSRCTGDGNPRRVLASLGIDDAFRKGTLTHRTCDVRTYVGHVRRRVRARRINRNESVNKTKRRRVIPPLFPLLRKPQFPCEREGSRDREGSPRRDGYSPPLSCLFFILFLRGVCFPATNRPHSQTY